MKVYEAIAQALHDNGVDTMFGLIGDANLFMVDSFVRNHPVNYVSAAHEGAAVLMAIGYNVTSGKVGVATTTMGPAVTNTVTALVEAVKARTPLLLICGDCEVEDKHHVQNVAQREIILSSGAGFEQARTPKTIVEDLATALGRATVERRPVVLNVPMDFQWVDIDYEKIIVRNIPSRGLVADSPEMDNAVGMLAMARRPVILAGRGAIHPEARAALLRLAERTGALLATTLKAKDLFRGEPYSLGVCGTFSTPGAVDELVEADCIVAFGASLNEWTTSHGTFTKNKRIIQCDLEPAAIGRYFQPDAGLVGDAALVAEQIISLLDMAEIEAPGVRSETAAHNLSAPAEFQDASTADAIDLRKVMDKLNAVLPEDRTVVIDGGRFMLEVINRLAAAEPQTFLFTNHFGSIGLGMPEAIGASYGSARKTVVLVTGDGGFMLGGLSEFNTVVRHNVDLIVVLCNDGSYGAEYVQMTSRQMDPSITCFEWPDFAPIATALGGQGVTIKTAEDLDKIEDVINRRDRALLIDVKIDPSANYLGGFH